MNDTEAATTGSLLVQFARQLRAAGVPSPEADARWLILHVSGCDPQRDRRTPVSDEACQLLHELVGRRAAREPVQLIVGSTAFRTLDLVCRPGVFIPRPETEQLAEQALRLVAQVAPSARIVEPCTGTGAVTCALVAEAADVEIVATDIDPAAVALAHYNVARTLERLTHEQRQRATVQVVAGDLFDPLAPAWHRSVDVVVANPPYLPSVDATSWEPEVRRDPLKALVGGPDGHEIVDRLMVEALEWLRPGGWLVVEIDARRYDDALARARSCGYCNATTQPDLTGAPRILRAQAPS